MISQFSWVNAIYTLCVAAVFGYWIVRDTERRLRKAMKDSYAEAVRNTAAQSMRLDYCEHQVERLQENDDNQNVRLEYLERKLEVILREHRAQRRV